MELNEFNFVDYIQGPGYLKRANTEKLQSIFNRYASVEVQGERYMTPDDLIRKFLGLYDHPNHNPKSVKLLAGIIDTSKVSRIILPHMTR